MSIYYCSQGVSALMSATNNIAYTERLPMPGFVSMAVLVLRWILLWLLAVLGLAVVYRYAPSRKNAKWRWVSRGSVVAATLWLASSFLFSL